MVCVWQWALTGFICFKGIETERVSLSDATGIKILQSLSEYHKERPSGKEMCIR